VKLAFILIEVSLAIAFGTCQRQGKYNIAAIIEWVIALVFTFYVFSFFMDFLPAVRGKHHQSSETELDVATAEAEADPRTHEHQHNQHGEQYGRFYGTGAINDHAGQYTNGHKPARSSRLGAL